MQNDLSALISTRICHDLINPLGAISNGLELLTTLNGTSGPEIDLVAESAERATAKLNYFRIAFGGSEKQTELKGESFKKIIAEMFAVGRFKVIWPEDTRAISRADGKLILLVLLAMESSAPLGGQCTVQMQPQLSLTLAAPRIAPNNDNWNLAAGSPNPAAVITAASVQFAAIADCMALRSQVLEWSHTDATLEVRVQ